MICFGYVNKKGGSATKVVHQFHPLKLPRFVSSTLALNAELNFGVHKESERAGTRLMSVPLLSRDSSVGKRGFPGLQPPILETPMQMEFRAPVAPSPEAEGLHGNRDFRNLIPRVYRRSKVNKNQIVYFSLRHTLLIPRLD